MHEHEDLYKHKEIEPLELVDLSQAQKEGFIHIDCPSCSNRVSTSDIDLPSKVAKCGHCNALFSIEKDLQHLETKMEERILRPEGLEILHYKDELELSTPQPMLIYDTLVLCILPFTAIFATIIYFAKGHIEGLYVAFISLIISAFSIFRAIRRKENRVYILLDNQKLTVQWRPNHLVKDRVYDVSDINQVYVHMAADGLALSMIVNGVTGSKHVPIIKRITNLNHAKYLEQEIERYLNIPNRKIAGEL